MTGRMNGPPGEVGRVPHHQDPAATDSLTNPPALIKTDERFHASGSAGRWCERPAQLHRRRSTSHRLPALESGRFDPWWYEPPAAGYQDAAAHLLGHGLLPAPPNREALRVMWKRGGHHRQTAQLIAEQWGLAG